MTGDIRLQLADMLDRVERLARAAGDALGELEPWPDPDSMDLDGIDECEVRFLRHVCRWDPATVLRMVERERELSLWQCQYSVEDPPMEFEISDGR